MAGFAGRNAFASLIKAHTCQKMPIAQLSNSSRAEAMKRFLQNKKWTIAIGTVAGSAVALGATLTASVAAFGAHGLDLHPPTLPWNHAGWFQSFDHQAIRRGYQVYKQVCSACHSLQFIHYRDLVGVCLTEAEAKAEAAEATIRDDGGKRGRPGPGPVRERPGKLYDYLPAPYPDKEAAMEANNGAYPPDLSYIALAREGQENYIFSLLTGYCDAPKGMDAMDDLYYNPYFQGAWIGMAQALYNEIIEYEDGTPATQSQLAKDVSVFLRWAAEPEHDIRKKWFLAAIPILTMTFACGWYFKRSKQIILRSQVTKQLDALQKKK